MTAALELIHPPPAVGAVPRVLPLLRPGVIGAAALKAARRSARMTRRRLARVAGVSRATVRAWENGTCPLYCVDYQQLRQLADVLAVRGTCVGVDVAELVLVSQCDLLIAGMLEGFEDYAEVPPIEEPGQRGDLACGFVRWALAGIIPDRLRGVADRGPLLAPADAAAITFAARDLQAGVAGPELAAFGAALLTLGER
jgi:transcriptional regulator with XRE-family HTH domain